MNTLESIQSVPLGKATRLVNYGPVVMVSSSDGSKSNVCTVAWCVPQRKSPPRFALAIGRSHKSYLNIMKTGALGINVPSEADLDLLYYVGTHSGNDFDKVRERNIEMLRGTGIETLPLVKQSAAWIECKLVHSEASRDRGIIVVEGVAAHCRKGVLDADYVWNTKDFPTLHHLGGKKFVVGRDTVEV